MAGQLQASEENQMEAHLESPGDRSGLISEIVTTIALSISTIALAIALAALIFTGPLQLGLSRATSGFVLASGLVTLILGVRGGFKPTIAIMQDGPAIVVVTLAAGLAGSGGNPVLNVFGLLALISLLTGLAMLVIGYLGAGDVVRYLPTTVISGFIAGTGWLLAKGGFDVMVDQSLGLDDLSMLFEPDVAKYWLPGAALGITIQVLSSFRRVPPIALSIAVLVTLAAFFGVVALFSDIESAEAANWFIGPFPDGSSLEPLTPSELGGIEWTDVLRRPGGVLAVIAVAVVAILLNLTSLATLTGDELNTKRELRWAGIANLVITPLGAIPGFHGLGDTMLARQMGARTKVVPVGVALISALVALFGSQLIGMTPRIIAGGLLVAVGLALLVNWVQAVRDTPSRAESVLSFLIPLTIATFGILEGITLGLVAACLIFVVRYSRIDPVKLETTALDLPSRVVRPASEADLLAQTADRILVFQLTGYQFFGSFTSVADRVYDAAQQAEPPLSSVIIDFRYVTGVDSSAVVLLDTLANNLAALEVQLLLSDLDDDLSENITSTTPLLMEGLDFALEHAENGLLLAAPPEVSDVPFTSLSPELVAELTRRTVAAGDSLIEQGSPSAAMFFILSGDLVVVRKDHDGSLHRLRRIGSGTIVGENSLLSGAARTAGVIAESDVAVLEVTAADYERLRSDQPGLAIELQDCLLNELAHRSVSLSEHLSRALR